MALHHHTERSPGGCLCAGGLIDGMFGDIGARIAMALCGGAVPREAGDIALLIGWLLVAQALTSRVGAWAERRSAARAVHVADGDVGSDGGVLGRSGEDEPLKRRSAAWFVRTGSIAGVIGAWGMARGASVGAASAAILEVLVMAEAARCDRARRLVPYELCVLMGAVGGMFQALAFGGAALASAFVIAACAVAMCCALSLFVRWLSSDEAATPLGGGDVRCVGAIALATGNDALLALGVGAFAAALFCVARFAVRSQNRHDPIPLAPFLMLGLVVGLAACF